jgi:hypothetical protein
VLFQVGEEIGTAEQLPADVRATLERAGVVDVRAPHADVLPGLFVAVPPPGADAEALVHALGVLPSVRNAEREELREAF